MDQARSDAGRIAKRRLQLRLEDVSGRMETLKQRRSAMERSKFKNASSPTAAGAAAIDENLGSLQAEIDSLQRQADALTRMQSELNVASPTDGQVITWDVAQSFRAARSLLKTC